MVTIKLELWENPNFPQLDILENQTNEVLEAFNKCRKLELELHGNDTEIKKFNISINTLTERRAQESFKHSSYSKNVAIYMDALSKESETVEAILIILSSLLVEARNRRESTNRLRQDYQDFLENFNNYYVIDNLNNEQIEIKNPEFVIPILSFLFSTFIFYLNMNCDPLSSNQDNACNNIPEILWRTLGHNASKDKKSPNDEEKQKDKEPQKDKKSSNDEKKQKDKEPQKDKKSNDEKEQKDEGLRGGKKSSNYEEKQKEEELKKDNKPLNNEKELKDRQSPKNEKSQNEKKKEEITTWCPSWLPWFWLCNFEESLPNTISANDTNNQTNGGTHTNDTNNQTNQTSGFSLSNQMNPVHPNVVNNHTNEINQTDQIHVSQYVNAIVFGILIALLMWILLRITKPKLYLPWMKDRKRKSQRLEELSQQKNNKILEIKNKLPVIITNVDILYQFWDNQIDCITNNSNTLRSVDEKEKIKIP
ncbi:hypothetical protein RhiirA1_528370, partial [Rhizophagus irregularis]